MSEETPDIPLAEGTTAPRPRWGILARVTVSALMLAVLVGRIPALDSLRPNWDADAGWWLAGAFAVTALGIVLSAVRWKQVLDAMGIRTKVRTLLGYYLAGQFVSNFLPSTIGGDVLRVTRLSATTHERHGTFASVVLERLTGWLVLPLITLIGLAVNPGLRELGRATLLAFLLAIGTLVALGIILWMAAHPGIAGRWADREGWQRFIGAVHLGMEQLRHNPGAAAALLAVGFAYQLSVMVAAMMAAAALGLDPVGPTAVLAFMPAVAIAQVLPISFGGLGVREGAFVLFLHPLGVATADAIALGLLVYGLNLAVSLLGAPAFASGGPGRQMPADA